MNHQTLPWLLSTLTVGYVLLSRPLRSASFVIVQKASTQLHHTSRKRLHFPVLADSRHSSEGVQPSVVDSFDEDRRQSLFQFLLRDLQIEGVPILEIDSENQAVTVPAAIWTTIAELASKSTDTVDDNAVDDQMEKSLRKACIVLEKQPINQLRFFVNEFSSIKTDLQEHIPELSAVSLSLVGEGVGPAVLIDVNTSVLIDSRHEGEIPVTTSEENERAISAVDTFLGRTSLETEDKTPTSFLLCPMRNTFDTLTILWNGVCQVLLNSPPSSTVVLDPHSSRLPLERFSALSLLMSRSLQFLCGSDDLSDIISLEYYHPEYDRDQIKPVDETVHGHLYPLSWTESIMRYYNGTDTLCRNVTANNLNPMRRSPFAAVRLDRVNEKHLVNVHLSNGSTVEVQNLEDYVSRAMKFISSEESR